jgi:hypothetical protein
MLYPQAGKVLEGVPGFGARRFVTLINANKYSDVPGELYSLRRRAIRYFESNFAEFDLYGNGWNQAPYFSGSVIARVRSGIRQRQLGLFMRNWFESFREYRCYRGVAADKQATLAMYKFCLCFENEACEGYITEKLFDCFLSGTVPVYYGAPNVSEYVPEGCYIDARDFATFGDLSRRMEEIGEQEFEAMQEAGQRFLRSKAYLKWKPEEVFAEMVRNLEGLP